MSMLVRLDVFFCTVCPYLTYYQKRLGQPVIRTMLAIGSAITTVPVLARAATSLRSDYGGCWVLEFHWN